MEAAERRAHTLYMSVSGNRGEFQIGRAAGGMAKEVSLPSPARLNFGTARSQYAPPPLRSPEQVKRGFLSSVAEQLRETGVDDMHVFVYHGHGMRGDQRGMPSRLAAGQFDVIPEKGKPAVKRWLTISGHEFAESVAAGFSDEADKDKRRHFQFDSCWLGEKRGKNTSSFIADFTSHMQKRGFTNFTVEGARTQLNTTGHPSYAANNDRHGVSGPDKREVTIGRKTMRPDLASGIPSLPSHVVPHPTVGGKAMDLLVRQEVPSRATLAATHTPAGNAAATKLQAIFRGMQVRRKFAAARTR